MRDLLYQFLMILGLGSLGAVAILVPALLQQVLYIRDPVTTVWLAWALLIDVATLLIFLLIIRK